MKEVCVSLRRVGEGGVDMWTV